MITEPSSERPWLTIGAIAAFLYLLCIVLANWAVENIGTSPVPGAPKVVPVGFGRAMFESFIGR